MTKSVVVLLPLLSLLALPHLVSPAEAAAPGWITTWQLPLHSLTYDPMWPQGTPISGTSDFFGAKAANTNATYLSMQAGGTTCALSDDTSGYWVHAAGLLSLSTAATENT